MNCFNGHPFTRKITSSVAVVKTAASGRAFGIGQIVDVESRANARRAVDTIRDLTCGGWICGGDGHGKRGTKDEDT